jgi:predicted 3-demethylubiquinone-9 3-methyltransferase (glyoxalase superfamily)
MQKLHPCLWFDDRIEDAANFYAAVFKGKVTAIDRMPVGAGENPGPAAGAILTAHVEILGQQFMLLNGGPQFKFNEAVSFVVNTKDQAETDYYWDALTADGGVESQCAWLKDKFGVSWQIVPERLGQLLSGSDKAGASRAMQAMFKMQKIVIADLEAAYAGR